jgi:23S rRNA pseudouridine2604 synthase
MTDPIRLSKRLAEQVGCSRREAELYIEGGWVTVDGQVVEEPQFKVEAQQVLLHPEAVLTQQEPITLIVHKPVGMLADDALKLLSKASQAAADLSAIRPLQRHFERLTLCLPLDTDACGLQVFTQNFSVSRKLNEDINKLEQEFIVEVSGELVSHGLKRLAHGLNFRGKPLMPCKVSWQNETRLRFALKNPLPGQIRHMCEAVGLKVINLKRIRIGGVPMAKLPLGEWRYLGPKEKF